MNAVVLNEARCDLGEDFGTKKREQMNAQLFCEQLHVSRTALSRGDYLVLLQKSFGGLFAHPALTHLPAESLTIGGFGRADRFSYAQHFGGPGEVANRVLLEAGAASGREPTSVVKLNSYISQFLAATGTSLEPKTKSHFRCGFSTSGEHTIEFEDATGTNAMSASVLRIEVIVRRKAEDKLDILRKRASEMKAALEAVQAKQREQEKADDRRIKALIGAAMVADIESANREDQAERKAYISIVLTRNTVTEPARAFLRIKGWL